MISFRICSGEDGKEEKTGRRKEKRKEKNIREKPESWEVCRFIKCKGNPLSSSSHFPEYRLNGRRRKKRRREEGTREEQDDDDDDNGDGDGDERIRGEFLPFISE